jgi:hypothetical protein
MRARVILQRPRQNIGRGHAVLGAQLQDRIPRAANSFRRARSRMTGSDRPRTLDALPAGERADIDEAVAAVRQHRTVMLGMPSLRAPSPLTSLPHHAGRDDQEPSA